MDALVVARQIRLAHELFSATREGTSVLSLAIRFVSEHVLVVVVPSCKTFLRAKIAAVCGMSRIRVPTVASSSVSSSGEGIGGLCRPRPWAVNAFF
jgi:hypothetical protein